MATPDFVTKLQDENKVLRREMDALKKAMMRSDEEVNILKRRVSEISEWKENNNEDSQWILVEGVEISSREGTPAPVVSADEKPEESAVLPTPPVTPQTSRKRPADDDDQEMRSLKKLKSSDIDYLKSKGPVETSKKGVHSSSNSISLKERALNAKRKDKLKWRQWILKKANGAL